MMAKLHWRVKTNGKWEFVSLDRYPNAKEFCECSKCSPSVEMEEEE